MEPYSLYAAIGCATSSTSTPSRFGLLTGMYPWRQENTGIAPGNSELIIDTACVTMADMFKAEGYATGAVGKWHLGLGPKGGTDFNHLIKPNTHLMADLSNTPYRSYKQWVFQGGTSSPLILTDGRSKSQTEKGSICREPSHIIDIFPTCLDIASAHYPDTFHNQKVKLAGTSLLPAIRKQKIQPRDLFFEHQTSCAILSDGWKLVRANGRQPWELIHLTTDPFETQDLSEQFPLKAKELENKWTRWAEQQHVYPFEYRPWTERINYYQSLYPDQKGKEN